MRAGEKAQGTNRSLKEIYKYLSYVRKQDTRSHSKRHIWEALINFDFIIIIHPIKLETYCWFLCVSVLKIVQ